MCIFYIHSILDSTGVTRSGHVPTDDNYYAYHGFNVQDVGVHQCKDLAFQSWLVLVSPQPHECMHGRTDHTSVGVGRWAGSAIAKGLEARRSYST